MENDQTSFGAEFQSEQATDPFVKARARADAAKFARLSAASPKPDDDDDCRAGAIGDYRQSAQNIAEQPQADRSPLDPDQTSFGYGLLKQPANFSQPGRTLSPLDKAREHNNTPEAKAERLIQREQQRSRGRDFGFER